jgi:hypothetical protein
VSDAIPTSGTILKSSDFRSSGHLGAVSALVQSQVLRRSQSGAPSWIFQATFQIDLTATILHMDQLSAPSGHAEYAPFVSSIVAGAVIESSIGLYAGLGGGLAVVALLVVLFVVLKSCSKRSQSPVHEHEMADSAHFDFETRGTWEYENPVAEDDTATGLYVDDDIIDSNGSDQTFGDGE